MTNTICLDKNYSTTRLLTQDKPVIINNPGDKFEITLFLPEGEGRKGEGGLRTKGYFKRSFEDKPLISIVTVVFNGEKYLEETIQSVINQTYDNVEYIIIDGCSTDGTLDIIKKYEHAIDYWVSEKDSGIYDAMNKGIHVATGYWINFMNADDLFYSTSVLDVVAHAILKTTANPVVVYGKVNLINSKNSIVATISNEWKLAKKGLKSVMTIPHQAAFTSTKRILEAGLFNTKYKIAGDYDLTLRVLNGYDALFIDNLVVAGRRLEGVSSNPSNSIKMLLEFRQAQKDNGFLYPSLGWILAYLRSQIRRAMFKVIGEKATFNVLDFLNRLLGRNTFWNNR